MEEAQQFGLPAQHKKKKGKVSVKQHSSKPCVRATEGEAELNVLLHHQEDAAVETVEPSGTLKPSASHPVLSASEQQASGVWQPDSGQHHLDQPAGKTARWGNKEERFRIGEVVWGREKGWPPWPALVVSAQEADLWKGIKGVFMRPLTTRFL